MNEGYINSITFFVLVKKSVLKAKIIGGEGKAPFTIWIIFIFRITDSINDRCVNSPDQARRN